MKAAIIVAHPDDETIWSGGLILKKPEWQWTVLSLCRARIVRPARIANVSFGFNEWLRAQDGTPRGQDWQTWSAAMYLYAAVSVERCETPFFKEVRNSSYDAAFR
jgi:hypothetical protein